LGLPPGALDFLLSSLGSRPSMIYLVDEEGEIGGVETVRQR
jgi:hypothetical protein